MYTYDGSAWVRSVEDFADNLLTRPVLKDYGIENTSPASASNVLVLDLENSNSFSVTLTEAVTTLTISNPPASGTFGEFYLVSTQDGTGGWSYTFPASVSFPGGTGPTQTTGAGLTDVYHFLTVDGGTEWHARQISADSK